jgi:hypothetical protein
MDKTIKKKKVDLVREPSYYHYFKNRAKSAGKYLYNTAKNNTSKIIGAGIAAPVGAIFAGSNYTFLQGKDNKKTTSTKTDKQKNPLKIDGVVRINNTVYFTKQSVPSLSFNVADKGTFTIINQDSVKETLNDVNNTDLGLYVCNANNIKREDDGTLLYPEDESMGDYQANRKTENPPSYQCRIDNYFRRNFKPNVYYVFCAKKSVPLFFINTNSFNLEDANVKLELINPDTSLLVQTQITCEVYPLSVFTNVPGSKPSIQAEGEPAVDSYGSGSGSGGDSGTGAAGNEEFVDESEVEVEF